MAKKAFYRDLEKHISATTWFEVSAWGEAKIGSYEDAEHVHYIEEVVEVTAHDWENRENDKTLFVECKGIQDEITIWKPIPCTGFELVTFFSKKGLTKAQLMTKITLELDRNLRA